MTPEEFAAARNWMGLSNMQATAEMVHAMLELARVQPDRAELLVTQAQFLIDECWALYERTGKRELINQTKGSVDG